MKTYTIKVAKTFPFYHERKGQLTNFETKILHLDKIHTIRGNYELWRKRLEVNHDQNISLNLTEWAGRPYHTKSNLLFSLSKNINGIGLQKLQYIENTVLVDDNPGELEELAKNDGLSVSDLEKWFLPYDKVQPMSLIHFTSFRY